GFHKGWRASWSQNAFEASRTWRAASGGQVLCETRDPGRCSAARSRLPDACPGRRLHGASLSADELGESERMADDPESLQEAQKAATGSSRGASGAYPALPDSWFSVVVSDHVPARRQGISLRGTRRPVPREVATGDTARRMEEHASNLESQMEAEARQSERRS